MKPITKVFLVIGVLVAAFLIWALFFNSGGILETSYNAVANSINDTWNSITGGSSEIIPTWKGDGNNLGDVGVGG